MRRPAIGQLPRLSLALLVAAMVLMAALLLELHSSAQAHRATAERALRLYAGIAVAELGGQARNHLRGAQAPTFMGVADAVSEAGLDRPLDPETVAALVRAREPACRCRLEIEVAFRYDHRDSTLAMASFPSAAAGPDSAWAAALRRDMPWFRPAPTAPLFQIARFDTAVPLAAEAQAVYHAASSPRTVLYHDTGHGLGPQAIVDRHEWQATQVGMIP